MRAPRFTCVSELKAVPALAHRFAREDVILACHGILLSKWERVHRWFVIASQVELLLRLHINRFCGYVLRLRQRAISIRQPRTEFCALAGGPKRLRGCQ